MTSTTFSSIPVQRHNLSKVQEVKSKVWPLPRGSDEQYKHYKGAELLRDLLRVSEVVRLNVTSDSFPVSAAGDEGSQQLFIRAQQGGIVGR